MKFNELNEHNYMLFAIKFYNNPQALTKEDFEDDLKRIKYVKRLLKRYKNTGILKTDLILNMCKAANAKTFIFGQDGKTYIEEDKFKQAGVKYKFQNFKHPIYQQRFPGFESNMSFIDLLFNYGDESIKIIKNENKLNTTR